MEARSQHPLLADAFDRLDAAGVPWRAGPGKAATDAPEDLVTLLVAGADRMRTHRLLIGAGFIRAARSPRDGSTTTFVAYDVGSDRWARIDLQAAGHGSGRRLGSVSFRSPGLSLALVGPDGAGKSSLAAALQRSSPLPTVGLYMGLYQGHGDGSGAVPPAPGLLALLWTRWSRWLTGRLQQARGRLVVFDRYTVDALLPADRPTTWRRRARRWLLARACPRPDLLVVLDAPGSVLHARKGEHDAAQLERRRLQYLALAQRLPGAIVLDATRPIDELRRRLTEIVWRRYSARVSR